MIKLRFLILLLLASLILSSCSPSKSKIELTQDTALDMPIEETLDGIAEVVADGPPELPEVDEVPVFASKKSAKIVDLYDEQEMTIKSFDGVRTYTYQGYTIKGMDYVTIEDFCDIARKVSLGTNTTKTIRPSAFDLENLMLEVTYKAGRNPDTTVMDNFMNSHKLRVDDITVSGEDKVVQLDLSDHFVQVTANDVLLLPIYYINSHLYNDQHNLIMTRPSNYLLSSAYIGYIFWHDEFYYEQIQFDNYVDTYNIAIQTLNEVYNLDIVPSSQKSMTYDEYINKLMKHMMTMEDSHLDLLLKSDDGQLGFYFDHLESEESPYIIHMTSMGEIDQLANDSKWLNEHTLYFPLDSFVVNQDYYDYFDNNWQDFISKNTNEKKHFIIDLRNNLGGSPSYAYYMLEKMAKDTVYVRLSNMYKGEFFSDNTYIFKQENYYKEDYDLTIITNEFSTSCSITFTGHSLNNLSTTVIGRDPLYKDANSNVMLQLPDGTIMTRSKPSFLQLSRDGVAVNEMTFVDNPMTDEEIDTYLASLSLE